MKTNRTVIIQCRLSSTRLPGKGLKDLCGKPVLAYVLQAMHKVKADYYYVATDEASYEELLPVCKEYGFECYAGSLEDVLDRFVSLLDTIKTKTVIRATADNPFLFYEAAEESAQLFEEKNEGNSHCDYLTYSGLPHGSGIEVFSAEAIKKAAAETTEPYDHEHVGPALYNYPDCYACEFVPSPRRYAYPELRTTIDTYSDYLRAVSMLAYLKSRGYEAPFTTEQIIEACRANSVKYPVVMVPSVVKGHGTGHLRRCLSAAKQGGFFVYIPEDKTLQETDEIIEEYISDGLSKNQIINSIPDESYLPAIITDTFELTENQLKELSKNRSLISIDEGSRYTDYCDYLLDIIPSYKCDRPANKTDSGFITMPKNVRPEAAENEERKIEKVLICLGGEDPSNLTMPAAQAFRKKFPDAKITAIISHADNPYVDYAGGANIEFIKPIPELREKLFEYDIVVTHYGLTAFEAVYAGCGVILLPTTKLHKKLAEKYNFAYVGDSDISDSSLQSALASDKLYAKKINDGEKKSLGEFLRHLAAGQRMCCPVCGRFPSQPDEVISRNETRTYRRCSVCGMVYMGFTTIEDKKYQKSYFFEEYKNQYGKTYQEDFEAIKSQGLRRVAIIKSLCNTVISEKEKTLLDIGCAYGPFLSAAADSSFNPFGTDISEDAVAYVQKNLKIPAVCSAFPEIDTAEEFGIAQFDVVTMWYVIEHFKDLGGVLRKVSSLVKKGGMFAFSTPSGEGISAVSDKNHFYEISPTDHYTIWEPSRAASILRLFGFKIERIVSTGHHPERFPSIKKIGAEKGSLQWKLTETLSRAKKLGDTVEIYCKKI